jgi:hypothetical protein
MRQQHGRNRAHAVLPSFGFGTGIAANIGLRLARAGGQAANKPRKFKKCLIDIVLPLD